MASFDHDDFKFKDDIEELEEEMSDIKIDPRKLERDIKSLFAKNWNKDDEVKLFKTNLRTKLLTQQSPRDRDRRSDSSVFLTLQLKKLQRKLARMTKEYLIMIAKQDILKEVVDAEVTISAKEMHDKKRQAADKFQIAQEQIAEQARQLEERNKARAEKRKVVSLLDSQSQSQEVFSDPGTSQEVDEAQVSAALAFSGKGKPAAKGKIVKKVKKETASPTTVIKKQEEDNA